MSKQFRHLLYRLRTSRVGLAAAFHLAGNRQRALGQGNRVLWGGARLIRARINIVGRNNAILIRQHSELSAGVVFDIAGDDNVITIGEGTHLWRANFRVQGSGHRITVGSHCQLRDTEFWVEDAGCRIAVGDYTTIEGRTQFAAAEPGSVIEVGANCMLAHDIDVRTSDSHSIVDLLSGSRINPACNVTIEDRVWIGAHTVVLKGVTLGSGAVIGTGSIVTRPVPTNCVAAGNPAVVRRTNATWQRERI